MEAQPQLSPAQTLLHLLLQLCSHHLSCTTGEIPGWNIQLFSGLEYLHPLEHPAPLGAGITPALEASNSSGGWIEKPDRSERRERCLRHLKLINGSFAHGNADMESPFGAHFGGSMGYANKHLRQGGSGLGPSIKAVHIVVPDRGPVGQVVLTFHAWSLVD